jgi:hypothetical protein
MTDSVHRYDPAAVAAVYRAIHERRDVRHFVPLAELISEDRWPAGATDP